jgi:hypothetical protein
MNHATKIRKLANAIRAYRGIGELGDSGTIVKWHNSPQPDKLKRIRELLGLLRFDKEEQENAIKKIDGFKRVTEFDGWIKEL